MLKDPQKLDMWSLVKCTNNHWMHHYFCFFKGYHKTEPPNSLDAKTRDYNAVRTAGMLRN